MMPIKHGDNDQNDMSIIETVRWLIDNNPPTGKDIDDCTWSTDVIKEFLSEIDRLKAENANLRREIKTREEMYDELYAMYRKAQS